MSNQLISITDFKVGFDTFDQPENAPNDAFPVLNNAQVFRGVLQKRKGFELLGILSVEITDITQANPGVVTTATEHGLTDEDEVNFQLILLFAKNSFNNDLEGKGLLQLRIVTPLFVGSWSSPA